jgi:hypothetical protein
MFFRHNYLIQDAIWVRPKDCFSNFKVPMMVLKVFIDTEFTDFVNPQLISLGMAASTGEEFYAEVPYVFDDCSDFVLDIVIPLLGRYPDSICSTSELPIRLSAWLNEIKIGHDSVEICCDSQTDWNLFIKASGYQVPRWCTQRMIGSNINELVYQMFYKERNLPEHHALYDARANRSAYIE